MDVCLLNIGYVWSVTEVRRTIPFFGLEYPLKVSLTSGAPYVSSFRTGQWMLHKVQILIYEASYDFLM